MKTTTSAAANRNVYVDIHVLQTLPPNCANRDDKGSPKTAVYGGVTRARISSQSIKASVRKYFVEKYGEEWVGKRTKLVSRLVADEIAQLSPGMDAKKEAEKIFAHIGKNEGDKTASLFFVSPAQAKAAAKLIVDGVDDKKAFEAALNENPTVDMALFGRMVAFNKALMYDASAQVAHAFSTHEVRNEYDYFSAVDDCEEHAQAAHIDTAEFNSSTLYRYANVNVAEAGKYLGGMTADAVAGFINAFINATPSGKEHSFAHGTLPFMVYVAIRSDAPVSFADAFEKPVTNEGGGYAENSERAFCDRAASVYHNYGNAPVKAFGFGRFVSEIGEANTLPELTGNVKAWISENL